jgi:electron-transferring-flavoprotein dehydrogenase
MEREVLEFDVQWIGAGPAGLAGAIHLSDLIEKHNQSIAAGAPGTSLPEVTIAVLEKAARVGAHGLSGLVMDPRAMLELMPDFRERGCPIEAEVTSDDVYLMWEGGQLRLPIAPPPLQNHGNLIASLGSLTEWMAGIAESKGVLIATETPAASPLVEAGRVVGVRSGDKGIDKHGAKKATYQPGADCRAKVTVLCEGPRGTIAKALEPQLGLTVGRNPQVYSTGVKELWEMPPGRVQKGRVTHTMGFPLSNDTFGGGFIYGAGDSHWAIGFVTGLDAHDPTNDPHGNLQRFKTHPLVRGLIEGGKLVSYGAKAIPEGGYWAMPKLSADGLLLCGDSGGFLNGARLKGVHLAIKSGMLAAETAFECLLAGDFSKERLAGYEKRFESSWAADELRSVRNFHQGFEHGLYAGMFHTGVQMLLGGRDLFGDRLKSVPGHQRMRKLAEAHPGGKPAAAKYDGTLTFDKLADVYVSGTTHEEDQPAHLVVSDTSVCATRCREEYGNPCQHFCPANVYEMVPDEAKPGALKLRINASNCVHCKTCDIADPYQIITWTTPEGGGGPDYKGL